VPKFKGGMDEEPTEHVENFQEHLLSTILKMKSKRKEYFSSH
jgi:hypothetical protein